MSSLPSQNITACLQAVKEGDQRAADRLLPLVYDELRESARDFLRRESPKHTLQATALVHETYLKLCGQSKDDWRSRTHFIAAAAQAMRRILVDHARGKGRQKRGGARQRLQLTEELAVSHRLDEDVLALDDALNELAQLDERLAKIVELRFFGGLTVQEVAEALGVSKSTVEKDWTMVRAWLRRKLSEDSDG